MIWILFFQQSSLKKKKRELIIMNKDTSMNHKKNVSFRLIPQIKNISGGNTVTDSDSDEAFILEVNNLVLSF